MSRKAIVAAVVALAATAFVAWELGIVFPRSGPLASSNEAIVPSERGDVVTLAFPLPNEKLDASVEVTSLEPFGVSSALEVVGTGIGRCDVAEADCDNELSYAAWPPRGVVLEDAEGLEIAFDDHVFAVVAVRTPAVPGNFSVHGVRIDYEQGWRRYRAEVGPDFALSVR